MATKAELEHSLTRWRARLKRIRKYERRAVHKIELRKRQLAALDKPRLGLDWAWGRPSMASLKAAGVSFACRYLSHDGSKNLSRSEADQLHDAGIDRVVVWETAAGRALSGRPAGEADARAALSQAAGCGMPDDRPIYFAVDFDATERQQTAINAYFGGVVSVLGVARSGAYGGYWVVKRLFDAGLIRFGWQTYAWSGGNWDHRAQLQQYSNGHRVGGVDCDYNRSTRGDFGQW
jgi:Domain of unknown function (DUF1906)